MIMQIREVSIAVQNLDDAAASVSEKFGLRPSVTHRDASAPVQARTATFRVGESGLALMESTAPGSAIDRFLRARGEGLFSVSLRVGDLREATERLRAGGAEFVCESPLELRDLPTYDGTYATVKMNFTRPKSTHGVVFELQELGPRLR